jgi:glyoxylase-like metal-dependent hydrolase (beta-lactamase superfamily II)
MAVLAVLTLPIFAQEDLGKTGNASINEVTNGIYLYRNRGGNILIAEDRESVLVVDTQFDDIAEELLEQIEKIAGKKPVKFVINTHHHADHTGGNARLAEEGAIVVAQENTRKRLLELITEASKNREKINPEMFPVLTFNKDLTFHFAGQEVEVRALPGGHTDGDAVVYFKKNNVIHAGDAFVNGSYPYFDLASGGSIPGYQEGLQIIAKMIDDNTEVMPGHGPLGSKRDVLYLQNMLNQVYKRVRLEYLKKRTLEEILAMTDITAEFDKKGFGDGFITRERFIESIVNDLKSEYDFEEIERQKERFKEAQQRANLINQKNKGGGR